jgi:hypothetical protein
MALMETRFHQGSANDTLGVDFTDAVGLARVTHISVRVGSSLTLQPALGAARIDAVGTHDTARHGQ